MPRKSSDAPSTLNAAPLFFELLGDVAPHEAAYLLGRLTIVAQNVLTALDGGSSARVLRAHLDLRAELGHQRARLASEPNLLGQKRGG